jgi:hypothetical protein
MRRQQEDGVSTLKLGCRRRKGHHSGGRDVGAFRRSSSVPEAPSTGIICKKEGLSPCKADEHPGFCIVRGRRPCRPKLTNTSDSTAISRRSGLAFERQVEPLATATIGERRKCPRSKLHWTKPRRLCKSAECAWVLTGKQAKRGRQSICPPPIYRPRTVFEHHCQEPLRSKLQTLHVPLARSCTGGQPRGATG